MPLEEMKNLINKRARSSEPIARSLNTQVLSVPEVKEVKEVIVASVQEPEIEVEKTRFIENSQTKNRLVIVVKKILSDIEKLSRDIEALSNSKTDTNNLKNNYKQFAEDTNANWAILNEKIKKIDEDNKLMLVKIEEMNDI